MTMLPQPSARARVSTALLFVALWLGTIGCANVYSQRIPPLETRNDPVSIPDGAAISDEIETRNGAVAIGEDAQVDDITTRNGAIVLSEGARAASIVTRNGAIVLRGDNIAEDIATRNGRIAIGPETTIEGSVETRNGRVTIEREATVNGDVKTRNGSVETEQGVRVAGEIDTRNGSLTLVGTQVDMLVDSRNGDIRLRKGTVIRSDVRLLMGEDWNGSQPPVLSIDADSRVEGRLIVDERARVDIEAGAEVPEVERFASREDWASQQ